jgi:hypothetical protein
LQKQITGRVKTLPYRDNSINWNLRLIKGLGGIVGLGLISNGTDRLTAKTVLRIVAKEVYITF